MNTPLGLLVWRWGSSRVAIPFLDGVGTRLQARAMGVVASFPGLLSPNALGDRRPGNEAMGVVQNIS